MAASGRKDSWPTPDGAPGVALAAAADRECRRIARALADSRHRHPAIHRARRAIRTLRALLGLLQASLHGADRAQLQRIDGRLKRLCRSLSPLRDAHVATLTAAALDEATPTAMRDTLAVLLALQRDAATRAALLRDPGFTGRRHAISALREATAGLPWATLDAHTVRQAIERSHRRVERAARRAENSPTALLRHRWRRRLRRLRLQLEAFDALPGADDGGRAAKASARHALKRQTDRLGQLQDVQLMCRLARQLDAVRGDPHLRAALSAALRRARREFAETR